MRGTHAAILANHVRRLEQLPRDASEELSKRTIGRTPVDTGSLANSFSPRIGGPSPRNVETRGGDISPVLSAIRSATSRIKPGDTYSMVNGQPYARRIEYGYSQRQAPGGMLRLSIAEWEQINRAIVSRLGN